MNGKLKKSLYCNRNSVLMIFDLITVIKSYFKEIGLFFFLLSLMVIILVNGDLNQLTIIKRKSKFDLKQKESI